MPELENDLRVPNGEAIHITHASAQDKGVVVEAAIGSVNEDDLSDFRPASGLRIVTEANFLGFCGSLYELAEIAETFHRRKAIGLQDELGFQVLDYIKRMAIRITTLLPARMFFSNTNSSFMAAVV